MTDEHFTILREDIATLREALTDRLDRLNGSVGRHEAQIAVLRSQAHPPSCDAVVSLVTRVTSLEQDRLTISRVWKVAVSVATFVAGTIAFVLDYVRR